MAGATTAITAGIGIASSGAQIFSGIKKKKEAEEALENYRRQELSNVADNLSVYTKGAEMQMEESARLGASSVDALSRSGVRGVIGGVGRLNQSQNQQQRQIAADLERQQARIDQIRAQDESRIRGMQEQREIQDINALSTQFQQGENMMWGGIEGLAQTGIGSMGAMQNSQMNQNYMDSMYGTQRPQQTGIGGGLQSMGVSQSSIPMNTTLIS